MRFQPLFHQEIGIEHLLEHLRAGLFAGLGLGKTSMSLSALTTLFGDCAIRGVLLLAPIRVCNLTWPNEVAKWDEFQWLKIANLRTKEGWEMLEQRSAHIYTANYEMIPKLVEKYFHGRRGTDYAFDTLVCDELTKFRNPKSSRAAALRDYLHHFPRRWGLTGTPRPKSAMDLFGQLRILDDGERLGRTMAEYRKKWFHPKDYFEYHWEPNEGAEDEIQDKIRDICLSLKSSDWLNIADTVVEDIDITLDKESQKAYKTMEKDLVLILDEMEEGIIAPNAAALVGKLLQLCSGAIYDADKKWHFIHDAKLKALQKIIKDHKGEPVMVACNYVHEQERIKAAFPQATMFQDAKTEKAQKALESAWNAGKIQLLVSDPRSMGHGLNLQDGGRVGVWFGPTYDREIYDQWNARLARQGQKKVPILYRLICSGKMDDVAIETLRERHTGQMSLLDALRNFRKMLL